MEYDLLCVLPINILNEKIYIFLWFWFLFLAGLSILNLLYRLLVILMPPLRRLLLRRRVRHYTLKTCDKLNCSYGDWFLLSNLGENMNPVVFSEILQEIHDLILSNPSTLTSIKKKLDKDNHNGQGSCDHLEESKPLNQALKIVSSQLPHHHHHHK